jgi:hypothetical protein
MTWAPWKTILKGIAARRFGTVQPPGTPRWSSRTASATLTSHDSDGPRRTCRLRRWFTRLTRLDRSDEMTGKAMGDTSQVAPPDPGFRTTSPEQAIHLCETAFYPHRLGLLGPTNSFGLTQRVTRVGPITVGDITYDTDVAINFDEARASYHVCSPQRFA